MARRLSEALREMAALADFMYGDGREAFDLLPERAQQDLRDLFGGLNTEMRGYAEREASHV